MFNILRMKSLIGKMTKPVTKPVKVINDKFKTTMDLVSSKIPSQEKPASQFGRK